MPLHAFIRVKGVFSGKSGLRKKEMGGAMKIYYSIKINNNNQHLGVFYNTA